MRFIDYFTKKIRDAAINNPDVQVAPACILWPDSECQWKPIISRLLDELPEILILGEYDPEQHTGPGIWLRCVIDGELSDFCIPNDKVPIIYLPGYSRQDLRAVESCPVKLKPLAELQYRGVIWSQINAKDWTILAFLMSDQGGLGLDVAQDNDTKEAMKNAILQLLDEEVEYMEGKRLDNDFFNTLLVGGDHVRDLLRWLDQPETFRAGKDDNEWLGFIRLCKSKFFFDPENDGVLGGATKLANHEGPWKGVWERFCEAPKRYSNIPTLIRKSKPPKNDVRWFSLDSNFEGWPQWNEERENNLLKELTNLVTLPDHKARIKIQELENDHASRRNLVWAELDEAPLANALEHLSLLSSITSISISLGNVDEMAQAYQSGGWKADASMLKALECVEKQEDYDAVKIAIQTIYKDWAEESARYLQKTVETYGYPGINDPKLAAHQYSNGECILFVDGLRFDVARRLEEMLTKKGFNINCIPTWAPLPSITATGKPSVTPVRNKIIGKDANTDFEPYVAETGQSLKGGAPLKKLMADAGWTILDSSSYGDGIGNAWIEFGNIDHEGHNRGSRLAREIESILNEIVEKIVQLFGVGWKKVRIVTDHGWLLLPGGLPKIDLPHVLTETKWGRCAILKSGALHNERQYPWYWNPNQYVVLADGISCFRKGEEYAHGGLSLQECFTLEIAVTTGSTQSSTTSIEFTDVKWKGLRCTIAVDGPFSGMSLDIRKQPANSLSTVILNIKPINENGMASVLVEDEDLEGADVTIVLLDSNGGIVAQEETVIGGIN
jgi:hypothetical protein